MSLLLQAVDRRFVLAIIKSFYDGRGLPSSKLIVLSGLVAGNPDTWTAFQEAWSAIVLSKTKNTPLSVAHCLHDKNFAALEVAVEQVNYWTRHGVDAYSCAVLMDDYRKCVSEGLSSLVEPEAICVDDIIPRIEFLLPDAHFEMYFDQNERFLRQVEKYWKSTRVRRIAGPYYLRNVEMLAKATNAYAAIQAADVYTWTVHTFCEKHWLGNKLKYIPDALQAIVNDPPISSLWDYERLKHNKLAQNRVLASLTKIPEWVLPSESVNLPL